MRRWESKYKLELRERDNVRMGDVGLWLVM